MTAAKIIGAVAGSVVISYVCDTLISDKKIFGGQLHYPVSGAALFPICHSELTAAFVSNQVRLQKQLPTRNGGRQLIKSSRPGLAPLDRPSSWTQLAGKISLLNHLNREANCSKFILQVASLYLFSKVVCCLCSNFPGWCLLLTWSGSLEMCFACNNTPGWLHFFDVWFDSSEKLF